MSSDVITLTKVGRCQPVERKACLMRCAYEEQEQRTAGDERGKQQTKEKLNCTLAASDQETLQQKVMNEGEEQQTLTQMYCDHTAASLSQVAFLLT